MPQDTSSLAPDLEALRRFLAEGSYGTRGAVMTDLDGTAVLEDGGRIYLPPTIEAGLQRVHAHGRPVIANTLRFPRSVIDVFGAEWHRVTGADLPLVSMKGSQIGRVVRASSGEFSFEEWQATTLTAAEIDEVLVGVEGILADGHDDLLVFYYPRDWRRGEQIWTPRDERIGAVAGKYLSASKVSSGPPAALREALHAEEMCMVFLLLNVPGDTRMAYQHTNRNGFFTHAGTTKADGALAIATLLGVDLDDCIGAGDASADDFLAKVGYAVIVGNAELDFKGTRHTARVESVAQWGELLGHIAAGLDP